MKNRMFAVVILLLTVLCGSAQKCLPDKTFWADFKGTIDNREIRLSVYRSDDDKLYGNYRMISDETKLFTISGYEKDCVYYLDVVNASKEVTAKFKIKYSNVEKKDVYKGSFTGSDNKEMAVQLQMESMVGGNLTTRYLELFGTTNEVDSFATNIKRAIMRNDKNWLAAHCKYPLQVYAGSHKPVIIKSEAAFLASYSKYFTPAYRARFSKMHCYNMMCTHIGALMGMGEIVINHTENSTEENYAYCIGSITIIP